jgi:hypothetical protein
MTRPPISLGGRRARKQRDKERERGEMKSENKKQRNDSKKANYAAISEIIKNSVQLQALRFEFYKASKKHNQSRGR